jgi:hypothetical protein
MKKIVISLLCVITSLFLTACPQHQYNDASESDYRRPQPTAREIEAADVGKLPKNYQALLKKYMELRLFDADSAKYQFGDAPVKDCYWETSTRSYVIAYKGQVLINAKNRYGAYTGFTRFFYFIKDGKVINTIDEAEQLRTLERFEREYARYKRR